MNGLTIRRRSRGAIVTAVRDPQCDGCSPSVTYRGRPGELRDAVDVGADERCARRQSIGRESQRILIRISGEHREDQRLANHRHLVTHDGQHRRLVGRGHREDEGCRGGQCGGGAGDVRSRAEGQCIIAAVSGHRRDMDYAGSIRIIREGRKARQAVDRKRERAAVRIDC